MKTIFAILLALFLVSVGEARQSAPELRKPNAKTGVVNPQEEEQFRRAAEALEAVNSVSIEGVKQTPSQACEQMVSIVRPLADKGYTPAVWVLASTYLFGEIPVLKRAGGRIFSWCPTLRNIQEGTVWLKRAADAGVRVAQRTLAEMYATGGGGVFDLVRAYALYDVTDGAKRECLSKVMTSEQIEQAQSVAASYRSTQGTEHPFVLNRDSATDRVVVSQTGPKTEIIAYDVCASDFNEAVKFFIKGDPVIRKSTIDAAVVYTTSAQYAALPEFKVASRPYMFGAEQVLIGERFTTLNLRNESSVPVRIFVRASSGAFEMILNALPGSAGAITMFPGRYQLGVSSADSPRTVSFYGERALSDLTYDWTITSSATSAMANSSRGSNLPQNVQLSPQTGQFPNSSLNADTDIRREIDAIANGGQYAPLPDDHIGMASRPNSTTARRIIRNETSYTLHLLMSGPVDRRLDLPPGGSSSIDLPPGSYRVAARADSGSVRPFYGVQVLEVGIEYTSQFYIKSQ